MILKQGLMLAAALTAITLSIACSDASPAAKSARSVVLAELDTAGSDLLTFAQRQRTFLQAVADVSLEDFSALVRSDFMIFDAMPAESLRARVPVVRFPDAWIQRSSFTAEFVRSLRDDLHLPYYEQPTYRLYRSRTRATVITYPLHGDAYLTSWDSTPAGWRATRVMINVSAPGLIQMENRLKASSGVVR